MIGYVTLQEAIEFLSKRFGEIEEAKLMQGLYKAFDKIETLGIRNGKKITENNFPRLGDRTEVMELVKQAQILEAYAISTGGEAEIEKLGKGITSKSIGDMSVTYDRNLKIGEVMFASLQAARIMKRFTQKTF